MGPNPWTRGGCSGTKRHVNLDALQLLLDLLPLVSQPCDPKRQQKATSERPEDNDDDDDNNDDQQSSYTRARKHSHTHTRRLDGDHPQINYSFYGGAIFIVFPTRPGLIGFGLVARAVPGRWGWLVALHMDECFALLRWWWSCAS